FRHANLDTALIEREHDALDIQHSAAMSADWALAAVLATNGNPAGADATSPWAITDGWRLTGPAARSITLEHLQHQQTLQVRRQADGWQVNLGDEVLHIIGQLQGDGYALQIGDALHRGTALRDGNVLHVFGDERQQRFTLHDPVAEAD